MSGEPGTVSRQAVLAVVFAIVIIGLIYFAWQQRRGVWVRSGVPAADSSSRARMLEEAARRNPGLVSNGDQSSVSVPSRGQLLRQNVPKASVQSSPTTPTASQRANLLN